MSRPSIGDTHPEVVEHIRLLFEYDHSYRQIADMVSRATGLKISRQLVFRVIKSFRDKLEKVSHSKRDKECPDCHSHLIMELNNPDDPDRLVCGVCRVVLERRIRLVVPKGVQVSQYQPSNRLSFNGLGQGNPDAVLIHAINAANPQFKKREGDYRAFMTKLSELKNRVGVDERIKKLKETACRRLVQFGFDKHHLIGDDVGRLIDLFYEQYIRPIANCFQPKRYQTIADSAIAVVLDKFFPEKSSFFEAKLQSDFNIISKMRSFSQKKRNTTK